MSLAELLVVAIVALVVFGPEKLPKLAFELGKLWSKWQKVANEFNQEFEKHVTLEQNEAKAEKADKLYQNQDKAE